MGKAPEDGSRRTQYDSRRTVNYYALLIGVIACVNLWIYWIRGSVLTLAFAIVCFALVVVWLLVARRMLR